MRVNLQAFEKKGISVYQKSPFFIYQRIESGRVQKKLVEGGAAGTLTCMFNEKAWSFVFGREWSFASGGAGQHGNSR